MKITRGLKLERQRVRRWKKGARGVLVEGINHKGPGAPRPPVSAPATGRTGDVVEFRVTLLTFSFISLIKPRL